MAIARVRKSLLREGILTKAAVTPAQADTLRYLQRREHRHRFHKGPDRCPETRDAGRLPTLQVLERLGYVESFESTAKRVKYRGRFNNQTASVHYVKCTRWRLTQEGKTIRCDRGSL